VSAVYWPYCPDCHAALRRLDRTNQHMQVLGFLQMVVVFYAVGAALGWYDFWYSSLGILAVFFVMFLRVARTARSLWDLESARIEDVYKGGIGAAYSFRLREYAERFAAANQPVSGDVGGVAPRATQTAAR
jgi:hypothetical protein